MMKHGDYTTLVLMTDTRQHSSSSGLSRYEGRSHYTCVERPTLAVATNPVKDNNNNNIQRFNSVLFGDSFLPGDDFDF